MGKKRFSKTKKIFLTISAASAVFAAVILFMLFWSPAISDNYKTTPSNNAAWVRHQVFSEIMSDKDMKKFISQIKNLNIKTVYIHIGPLDSKGDIPEYDLSKWVSNRERIRKAAPDLKIFAWIGGLHQSGFEPAPDTIDMQNDGVLLDIAKKSSDAVNLCEFDGIHYDIEPLPDNDTGFIKLLQLTRMNLKNKEISIASPHIVDSDIVPKILKKLLKRPVAIWGPYYYRQVAELTDEIAVMSYDSLRPTGAAYKKFIMNQVRNITDAINGTNCRLLIGIPTYGDKTISHDPSVETTQNALQGAILGLQKAKHKEIVAGAAIYALWTMDDNQMETFQKIWVKNKK